MGCTLEVTIETIGEKTKVLKVTDNNCPRGPKYVEKEFLNPTRTLTSTIAVIDGDQPLVPVKTDGEIPRNMIMQCMEIIRRTSCNAPIASKQILINDILGTGINIISCYSINKS